MEIKKTGVSATSFKMAVLSSAITLASCGGGGGGIDVIAPEVVPSASSSGSGSSSSNNGSDTGNQTEKTESDFFIQKLSVDPTNIVFTDKPVTFSVTTRVSEVATGGAVSGKAVTLKLTDAQKNGLSLNGASTQQTDASGVAAFSVTLTPTAISNVNALISNGVSLVATATRNNGDVKTQTAKVTVSNVPQAGNRTDKINLLTSKTLNANGDSFDLKAQLVDSDDKFIASQDVILRLTDANAQLLKINNEPGNASIQAKSSDQGIVSFNIVVPDSLSIDQKKQLSTQGVSGTLSFTDSNGQLVSEIVSLKFDTIGNAQLSISSQLSKGTISLSGETVNVSVLVTNTSNNAVANQEVNFSLSGEAASNGVLLETSAKQKTNSSGVAVYKITVPSTLSQKQRTALAKGIAFGYATTDRNGQIISNGGLIETKTPNEKVLNVVLGTNKIVSVTGDKFKVFARVTDSTTKLPVGNRELKLFVSEPLKTGVSIVGSSAVKTNSDGVAVFDLQMTPGDNVDPRILNAGIKLRATVEENNGLLTEQTYVVPVDQNSIENYLISSSVSKTNLITGGDEANVIFRVADTNGGVLKNVPVVLSIENPQVSGATLTTERELKTNEQGVVTTSVVLSAGTVDSRINHDIKLKATISRVEFDDKGNPSYSEAAVQEVTFIASGTSIDITSNKNNLNPGDEVTVTVVAKDGLSNNIAGANVILQDSAGNALETEVVTKDESGNVINKLNKPITNENGEVRFKLKEKDMPFDANGNAKVFAKIFGETKTQDQTSTASVNFVAVDKSGISFINLDEAKGTPIGQNVTVKVQIRAKDASELAKLVNSKVVLETTLGKIKDANDLGVILSKPITSADVAAATGNSIVKEFIVSSELAGTAGLISKLENKDGKKVLEANAILRFIATVPHKLLLQATDNVLVPGGSTEIVAIVKNKDDVPVENVKVIFTRLKDSSAGALSAAQAITNEKGEARVRYTAGASTPDKGVVLDAQIATDRTIESQPNDVSLTVSRQAAYLTIGLSDRLVSSEDNIYYSRATSAALVDASGRPVVNQPVSVKLFANRYALGCFGTRFIPGSGITPGFFVWQQNNSTLYASEDKNRNFTLDPGEDGSNNIAVGSPGKVVALNGKLEPANPVTIIGGKLEGNTYTFVTDEEGKFDFNLRYPKTYAEWMELEISASSNVFGSETNTKTYFTLPVSAPDVTLSGSEQIRPNPCSPFNDAGFNR